MDRKAKKEYLINLIKQSELCTSKLNTTKMKWEPIDLEKVADFFLDNGVDIINPFLPFATYFSYHSGLCSENGEPLFEKDLDYLFDMAEKGW